MVIESVSDEKRTRVGPGHFITWVTTYRDEQGAVVGRQTFRILKFSRIWRPAEMSDRLAPTTTPDTKFFWDALKEGKLLMQRCAGCARAAPSAPADVSALQLASVGHDRVVGTRRGLQLRAAAPPAVAVVRRHLHRRAGRARGGHRIVSNLCDVDPDDVTIGMPVQAFVEHFDNGVSLPQFRPRSEPR
jgi:uncharacterized OB-fold protein